MLLTTVLLSLVLFFSTLGIRKLITLKIVAKFYSGGGGGGGGHRSQKMPVLIIKCLDQPVCNLLFPVVKIPALQRAGLT